MRRNQEDFAFFVVAQKRGSLFDSSASGSPECNPSRNDEADFSTGIGGAGDSELTADTRGPLAHSLQAVMSVGATIADRFGDADSVVPYGYG